MNRTSDVAVTAEFRCWRWENGGDVGVAMGAVEGDALVDVLVFPGEVGQGEHASAVRAYQAAWRDLDEADVWLEKGFSEDGRFVDPTAEVHGRSALVEHIRKTMSNPLLSKFTFAEVGGMDLDEGAFRFHWDMQWKKSGRSQLQGYDIGQLDAEGRVELLVGCWE